MAPVFDLRSRRWVGVCPRGHYEKSERHELIAQWLELHVPCSADVVRPPASVVGISGTARNWFPQASQVGTSSVASGTGTFDGPSAA